MVVSGSDGALDGIASVRATPGAGGVPLPYVVAGTSGPYIVCVNALGQDLLVFSRLIRHFARSNRVIAWRPRGTFEPADAPATTIWDQVADLRRILDAERIGDCALVTWCSGAKVAIEFARRSPEVSALVLTNGTFTSYPGLEHAATEFEKMLLELCLAVVEHPELADMVMDSMLTLLKGNTKRFAAADTASSAHDDPALAALIREPFQSPRTTRRYAAQVVDYLSHDVSESLDALQQRALVIAGQNDRISSSVMAEAVAGHARAGSFAEIEGGSHYCLYESADRTIRLIEAFLDPGRVSPQADFSSIAPSSRP
jgi:pimeloyl-ACP methyl ester carboxylesterase